jgi:hypothetical protein
MSSKKNRHDASGQFTTDDVEIVQEYIVKAIVLETLPVLQRNLHFPAVLGQEIQAAVVTAIHPLTAQVANLQPLTAQVANLTAQVANLQPLTAQVATLNAQMATLITESATNNALLRNSLAEHLDDVITPPFHGAVQPPQNFPKTVSELVTLRSGALLNAVETYYELAHTGTLIARLRQVRRAYGVRSIIVI